MGKETNIAWTDRTWSPWLGCRKISPGCHNCFIVRTTPFRTRNLTHGSRREQLSENYWKQPERWNREAARRGVSIRVFPSLCDVFDQEVPTEWKERFWKLVWRTSNLTWLILTKRPQYVMDDWAAMVKRGFIAHGSPLPQNVWLGVTAENQEMADVRIPILLSIPAKVRFLSVEPMLERIELSLFGTLPKDTHPRYTLVYQLLDLVIYGGESGHKARECHVDWIRDGVRQCREAGIPVFVKQLGRNPTWSDQDIAEKWYERFSDPAGANIEEMPHDIRIRELPAV